MNFYEWFSLACFVCGFVGGFLLAEARHSDRERNTQEAYEAGRRIGAKNARD